MEDPSELPRPAPEALTHSHRLAARIREEIRASGGWLDFSRFMDLALYAPGLGYYSAGSAKFGPAGDFVTAPEISPLFARCLARACLPLLAQAPGAVILELGAGTGSMAAGLLDALARHGLPGVRYQILEVSADLRERQRSTLAERALGRLACVEWLDELPAAPLRGVVIANEVVDALPVTRFAVRDGRVHAVGVVEASEGFSWSLREASAELRDAVAAVGRDLGRDLPEGYVSEVSLQLPAWLAAVAAALANGALLLSDYGMSRREYYHPQRRDGTLVCHYRHRAHADPFLYPGLQDITAWVDFTAVAEAGANAGLQVAGYSTQAHFLLDSGLEAELAELTARGGGRELREISHVKTLLLPGEMGERYKVMALTRGDVALAGFGFRDLRHLL